VSIWLEAFVTPLIAVLLMVLADPAPPMVVVRETDVMRQEVPPHNGTGQSTAYRISDAAPGRNFEFRKRVMRPGAAIGLHVLKHDEIYYVLSGRGEVTSDGVSQMLEPGMAAYLYEGADVGIRQAGEEDLVLIIAYPLKARMP
jgi:mannose-6-phosphate isomerase-like protein (cupin superfamily)